MTTAAPHPVFSQLTVTLKITHNDGVSRDTQALVAWVLSCTNCNPDQTVVQVTNPTGLLGWPDFLDDPGYREEHPDWPEAVELLHKVEAWLTLDRKQLIDALIARHVELRAMKRKAAKAEASC